MVRSRSLERELVARIERFEFHLEHPNPYRNEYPFPAYDAAHVHVKMEVDGKVLGLNQYIRLDQSPAESQIQMVMNHIARRLEKGYREGQL